MPTNFTATKQDGLKHGDDVFGTGAVVFERICSPYCCVSEARRWDECPLPGCSSFPAVVVVSNLAHVNAVCTLQRFLG